MRVLAVTNMFPTPQFPGSGTFVEQQVKGLERIGLNVDVMCVDRDGKGMAAYASFPGELRKKIALSQPDLVHIMYGGFMAALGMHNVGNRPVVVTFHGTDLLGESYTRPLRRLLSACGVMASRHAARRCDGIVIVAEHLRSVLPTGIDNAKVRVIPCGIDLELFKPLNRDSCRLRLNWQRDTFHVLFCHRRNPVKRPSLAYAAMERLKQLGIRAELHELRNVRHEDVPLWVNASDALLLTSIHEGSPTIVKEGLACNLPIVSVDVGDVRERIEMVEGCYLASPDPSDLAEKLAAVHAGASRVAGRLAVQHLGIEAIAAQLKQFYLEVSEEMHKPLESLSSSRFLGRA